MMLEKLVFKIGDREIELNKNEAKQLRCELNEIFQMQPLYPMPYIIPTENPYQNGPWYVDYGPDTVPRTTSAIVKVIN